MIVVISSYKYMYPWVGKLVNCSCWQLTEQEKWLVHWRLASDHLQSLCIHIVQQNLTYSLNNALWWTMVTLMGYLCPVHNHISEGKGVNRNCLWDTLFISWYIELNRVGYHLVLIWVASVSTTLSRSVLVEKSITSPKFSENLINTLLLDFL